MSLEDEMKSLREQYAAAVEKEEKDEEEVIEEEGEPEVAEPEKEQEKEPEVKKEEVKEEVKEEKPEEKPDALAFQRMRREKAALEKKLAALEERPKAEETEAVEEVVLPPALQELLHEKQLDKAAQELTAYEADFRRDHADFDDVSAEYTAALSYSIKVQNPRLTDQQLQNKVKEAIIYKAAALQQSGYNPIEEMYHEAKELGFTGKSRQKQEVKEEKEAEVKPDMKKLSENRKRSTNMTASNGKSEGDMTRQYAASELSVADWQKLSVAEKQRLMYG